MEGFVPDNPDSEGAKLYQSIRYRNNIIAESSSYDDAENLYEKNKNKYPYLNLLKGLSDKYLIVDCPEPYCRFELILKNY